MSTDKTSEKKGVFERIGDISIKQVADKVRETANKVISNNSATTEDAPTTNTTIEGNDFAPEMNSTTDTNPVAASNPATPAATVKPAASSGSNTTLQLEFLHTDQAPAALGPYSQAILVGKMVYTSGQVGIDPVTGELAGWQIKEQTTQVFKNLQAVLSTAGCTLQDVVKSTVFLTHMSDFAEMNAIYAEFFGEHRPARSTIEVSRLPKDSLIEIEVIALAK